MSVFPSLLLKLHELGVKALVDQSVERHLLDCQKADYQVEALEFDVVDSPKADPHLGCWTEALEVLEAWYYHLTLMRSQWMFVHEDSALAMHLAFQTKMGPQKESWMVLTNHTQA
jgi:hypothetical protein